MTGDSSDLPSYNDDIDNATFALNLAQQGFARSALSQGNSIEIEFNSMNFQLTSQLWDSNFAAFQTGVHSFF